MMSGPEYITQWAFRPGLFKIRSSPNPEPSLMTKVCWLSIIQPYHPNYPKKPELNPTKTNPNLCCQAIPTHSSPKPSSNPWWDFSLSLDCLMLAQNSVTATKSSHLSYHFPNNSPNQNPLQLNSYFCYPLNQNQPPQNPTATCRRFPGTIIVQQFLHLGSSPLLDSSSLPLLPHLHPSCSSLKPT